VNRLVVTFDPDEDTRRLLEAQTGEDVSIDYLADDSPEERRRHLEQADVLVGWSLSRELNAEEFERLRDDQVLQTLSAGVDHLPLDRLPDGLTVLSNAGAYADPMAEHVLALYLALSKRLAEEDRCLRDGSFNQFRVNRWVRGSRCAILGFGAIGRAVARLMGALDVTVDAINRSGTTDAPVAFVGGLDRLETVLRRCDVLVISAPLTSETRGLIDEEKLGWMKDDAMLINVARAEILDPRALYEHLKANPEFRAGLDVWWTEPLRDGRFELEYPLLDLPNVLGSPHNASMVPDVLEIGLRHALDNLRRFREGARCNVVDRRRGY